MAYSVEALGSSAANTGFARLAERDLLRALCHRDSSSNS
jgi:hypothetical protein